MGAQRPLTRRRFLRGLGGLVALGALEGCARRDRSTILKALVREVVVGMAGELRSETEQLHRTLRSLNETPRVETATAARAAWKPTLLAWKRAQAFRMGPFTDSGAFDRAVFWPASPGAVDELLAAHDIMDEARVQGSSVHARGLHALEYVLFAPGPSKDLPAPRAAKRRAYALQLSANVLGYAERIGRMLGDGHEFAEKLGSDGARSVQGLVAQCLDTFDIALGKLSRLARARAAGSPLASAVEGHYSGTSHEVVQALLVGAQRLYIGGPGGGLSELVARASSPIDEHTRFAFAEAESRLRALTAPLELAIDREPERYRAMADSLSALRHIFATETSSALET